MMEIVFREKYVDYSKISDVNLMDIHNLLLDDNISIELGDKFANDWAGYSYFYCKSLGKLDKIKIASFVYVISWFMTGDGIDIYSDFKSDYYYKNDKIIIECLKIHDELLDIYDSEVELCRRLFNRIYSFYSKNVEEYVKLTERINCLVSYKELELLDGISGDNRSEKIRILLENYYNQ